MHPEPPFTLSDGSIKRKIYRRRSRRDRSKAKPPFLSCAPHMFSRKNRLGKSSQGVGYLDATSKTTHTLPDDFQSRLISTTESTNVQRCVYGKVSTRSFQIRYFRGVRPNRCGANHLGGLYGITQNPLVSLYACHSFRRKSLRKLILGGVGVLSCALYGGIQAGRVGRRVVFRQSKTLPPPPRPHTGLGKHRSIKASVQCPFADSP